MKAIFCKLLVIILLMPAIDGQSQANRYRFEAETGGGTLHLPAPYRTGWHFRQQVTGYLHPRLGVGLGFLRGGSVNTDPLDTGNPARPPDPARITEVYSRQETVSDLTLVWLPVLTRRHQIKVQVGVSSYKRRELRADSVIYPFPGLNESEIRTQIINTRRAVPTVSLGYDYRFSPRWSLGVGASVWLTGESRPTSVVGLRTAYRFNLPGDSLGINSIRWNELRYGLRGGSNLTAINSRGAGGVYRVRFTAGVWAEIPLSMTWALQGEINYSQRGYRNRETSLSGSSRILASSGNLNYLELPLLFRHEVAPRWHLYFGPQLSIFLNGQTEVEGKPNPPVLPHVVSGIALGVSRNLSDNLFIDLRYQRDLIRLSSNPYGGLHAFQLTAGYALK